LQLELKGRSMRNDLGARDPDQLRALQDIFDEAWLQITSSSKLIIVADWHALRDDIACKVMDYAPSSLTDDEIIRAILASLGIQ